MHGVKQMARRFSEQQFERILELSFYLQAAKDVETQQSSSGRAGDEDHFLEEHLFEVTDEEGIPRDVIESAIRVATLEEKSEKEAKSLERMREWLIAGGLSGSICGILALLIFFGVLSVKLPKSILPTRDHALVASVFYGGIALFCGVGAFMVSSDIKKIRNEAKLALQKEGESSPRKASNFLVEGTDEGDD